MIKEPKDLRTAPLEQIQKQPWSFAALALATGFGLGMLFRIGSLRKALRVYAVARKFI